MNIEIEFLNAMQAAGLDYTGEVIADGALHRIKVNGDRNPNGWYVLHGDHPAAGAFGDYKRAIKETWCAHTPETLTAEERAERDRKWQAQREAAQAEKGKKAAAATQRGKTILDAAQDATDDHPYLVRKRVKAYSGLKVGDWPKPRQTFLNCLLIPLRRFDGALATVQAIYPTIDPETGRDKDLLYQGQKTGAAFVIGDLSTSPVILIAEGYATAATLYEATGYATVMAIDAGNLKPVMRALAALYSDKPRLVCADNDRFTDGNPGLTAARAAARESRALPPAIPEFLANETGKDFNDLINLQGKEAVRSAIEDALQTKVDFSRAGKDFSNKSAESAESAESITYKFSSRHEVGIGSAFFEITVPNLTTDDGHGSLEAVIDSEAAQRLATALHQRVAFCRQSGIWHGFTGTHWEPLENGELDELINRLLYAGTRDCGFKAHYHSAVVSLLRKGLLPLPLIAASDTRLIPFSNGLLNPETRVMTSVTPDNAMTWCLPYAYDPDADCPKIKAWLKAAVNNCKETLEFLRAFFAALLTGRADLQKFLHLLGKGQSGKGTFLRLLVALLGAHNTASTDLRRLEQNRFETAKLYGKRLAAITDSSRYGGSVDTLKALTGQDLIPMERKHKDPASFVYEGLVIIASNEPLQFTDYTGAVERRRLTVQFDRTTTDAERNLWNAQGGEAAILHQEIPGLVNWCLQLTRDDVDRLILLDRPDSVIDANLDALRASNPIADWLMENTLPEKDIETQIGVCRTAFDKGREVFEKADRWLYANYLTWCKECRREPVSLNRFTGHVLDMGSVLNIPIKKDRNERFKFFKGLRIRLEFEAPHDWNPVKNADPMPTSCRPKQQQAIDSANNADLPTQNANSLYTGENHENHDSLSLLAIRILDLLNGSPAGFSQDEIIRQCGNGKGASPKMIELALTRLMKEGAIRKQNGNWVVYE